MYAVDQAIREGRPLIDRVTTVGGLVNNPGNFLVRIGTTVEYLLDALLRAFPLDDAGSVRYCALIDVFLPLFDDYLLSAGLLSL